MILLVTVDSVFSTASFKVTDKTFSPSEEVSSIPLMVMLVADIGLVRVITEPLTLQAAVVPELYVTVTPLGTELKSAPPSVSVFIPEPASVTANVRSTVPEV